MDMPRTCIDASDGQLDGAFGLGVQPRMRLDGVGDEFDHAAGVAVDDPLA